MDAVTLSRIETEWLAACFYGRSRLMPREVRERLEFLGLIDDRSQLTAARLVTPVAGTTAVIVPERGVVTGAEFCLA